MRRRAGILAAALALLAPAALAQPAGGVQNAGAALRPFQVIRVDPAFDRLVAADAKLETIATLPGVKGEGPMWRKGRLWYSDLNGPIRAVGLDGRSEVLFENAGGPIDPNGGVDQGPNGQAAWKDGSVLVARQAFRDIGRLDRKGTFSPLVGAWQGKRLNSPNDLVVGRDGTVWFTDPPYGLPGVNRPRPDGKPGDQQIPFSGVFRFKDGRLDAVVTDMDRPNGIGLSPDGRTLYVSNTRPMYLRAYDIGRDGALSNLRELVRFADDSPFGRGAFDGLKVDSLGDIWTTGPGGIVVLDPKGKLLGRIQLPAFASNMAFGDDYRSLFITSGPNIYRIRTLVRGQVPPFTER